MQKIFRLSAVLFASTIALLAGCHKGPQDGVVATVNGHPILRTEVDRAYNAQLANNPPQQQPSSDQVDAAHLQILQNLITEEIMEQRAAKQGLTATDAEVDAKVAEAKAPYTEEQFQAKLKGFNYSGVDELRRDLRRNLNQTKLIHKEIDSKITVTDGDVDGYYKAHKAEYSLAENAYHLAQIIVSTSPTAEVTNGQNSKATSDTDARKKIEALKTRLDSGEDFGALASQFSENPQTASNGGDMGLIPESQLRSNPTLYAAIGKLKAGQDTGIIPFPDQKDPQKVGTYAIFRLLERAAAGQRDLSDPRVQEAIRRQLHDSRAQLLRAAYLEMLRDQSKVDNYLAEQIFKSSAK